MPNQSSKKKRPADANKLAFQVVQESTGQAEPEPESDKNPVVVALGRLGGMKGSKARAKKLSQKRSLENTHQLCPGTRQISITT
jgi:hypothetical protein